LTTRILGEPEEPSHDVTGAIGSDNP